MQIIQNAPDRKFFLRFTCLSNCGTAAFSYRFTIRLKRLIRSFVSCRHPIGCLSYLHFHTCPFFRQISPSYSQLAPRWAGNTAGGPIVFQPLTEVLKVLLITTQSLPPGLLRRAAGVSFSSHRQSMAIEPSMAPLRAKCIALRRTRPTPLILCTAVCTSWRFSRRRSCQ